MQANPAFAGAAPLRGVHASVERHTFLCASAPAEAAVEQLAREEPGWKLLQRPYQIDFRGYRAWRLIVSELDPKRDKIMFNVYIVVEKRWGFDVLRYGADADSLHDGNRYQLAQLENELKVPWEPPILPATAPPLALASWLGLTLILLRRSRPVKTAWTGVSHAPARKDPDGPYVLRKLRKPRPPLS